MKKGFTLVELLVVVLIIGILAAVALPQYNKAVRKSRLAAVQTTLNALMKGVDLYILENGYEEVSFIGSTRNAELAVEIPFTEEGEIWGVTKEGAWTAYCTSESCAVRLLTSTAADGTDSNNTWLDKNEMMWLKKPDTGTWQLWTIRPGKPSNRDVCQWWVQNYGKETLSPGGWAEEFCNALL